MALSDFVGERHDLHWGTSIYQKSWHEVGRATGGAGLRGQGEPIRGASSPRNPAAVRGPPGIWKEETLPVTGSEAPAYRVALPQTLLEATGVEIPVLRWSRKKRDQTLREHPADRGVIDTLNDLLPLVSRAGRDPRPGRNESLAFFEYQGPLYRVVMGPDRSGSFNVVSVYGTSKPSEIRRWQRDMASEGMIEVKR